MEKNNKSNKFFTGFLWGVALGAGVALFLKSEKGKELLKKMKDEGLDQISEMAAQMSEDEEEEVVKPQEQHPLHTQHHDHLTHEHPQEPIKVLHVHAGQVDTEVNVGQEKETKKSSKKFFKGIGKK